MRLFLGTIFFLLITSLQASGGFYEGLMAAQKKDWETALAEWLPIAEEGNPGAQSNLGNMYAHGLGVEKNDETAFQWHYLAAEQGMTKSMIFVGLAFAQGLGVQKDLIQAGMWLLVVKKLGHPSGVEAYGFIRREFTAEQEVIVEKLADEWEPN